MREMNETTFRRLLTGVIVAFAMAVVMAQNPVTMFQWGPSVDTNSGNKSANTLRVTLATDQVQPTNAFKVDGSAVTQPVSGTFWQATQPVSNAGTFAVQAAESGTWNVTNVSGTVSLPTGASTETTLGTRLSESDFDTKTGSLTEGAPASDTASSGLNGRLQRIAQRLTSLIAQFGTIGAAPPAVGSYTTGLGSGATGGLVVPMIICDSQGYLDMTTATTTEIAPLVSSRTIKVCNATAMANGTTVLTFKRGTGTNCGTGTTSVSPAWDLTAQAGFSWTASAGGFIIGPAGAGTAGGAMTSGNALCATSSAAVNLHIHINYAVF